MTEVDAEHDGGSALQEEQHAARRQQLVDRRRAEQRRNHQHMQQNPEHTDTGNADQRGEQVREVIYREQKEHAVHAEHDQFSVAYPHDIDHTEDQVQAECQQCQHAAQQHAIEQRLQQIDVEDAEHRLLAGLGGMLTGGVALIVGALLVFLHLVVDQSTGEACTGANYSA